MIVLQMLNEVPKWAIKRGLSKILFDKLEEIIRFPEHKQDILMSVEYDERCCLKQALEYAEAKGLTRLV